jgi:NTE family protein
MNALVLSGGSIKGAFQAGALRVVLQSGLRPDYIWGVSVGALNGAFLADRAGRAVIAGAEPRWQDIGGFLVQFWTERVTRPSDIVTRRSTPEIAWNALLGRFNGLLNTNRRERLIRQTVRADRIAASPAVYKAGVVDLGDGHYFEADSSREDLVDYIVASAAIPILMPIVTRDGAALADGGVREIAPLRSAIHAGATNIIVIAPQSEHLEARTFNPRNVVSLTQRVMEILLDEILQNDLAKARHINAHCPVDGTPATSGPYAGKRRVDITLIRPSANFDVDLLNFAQADIRRMIEIGEKSASIALRIDA